MECGGNTVCEFVLLISENEVAAGTIAKLFGVAGAKAQGLLGLFAKIIDEHGEKLIALLGLAFGVWRWWRYREAALHKRLKNYLEQNDRRLTHGRSNLLQCLTRPGPGQKHDEPLFADRELRAVLRESNWDQSPMSLTIEQSCELQLARAIEKINDRIKTADNQLSSLRLQLSTAHLLTGAIAASRADRRNVDRVEAASDALISFRSAQQVPGHNGDIAIKELEAHQLRKVGQYQLALEAFQKLEEISRSIASEKERDLMLSKTLRYRAETEMLIASRVDPTGIRVFEKARTILKLLHSDKSDAALSLRIKHGPFSKWDLLDQADLHYLTAFISMQSAYSGIEQRQLQFALSCYQDVHSEASRRKYFGGVGNAKLRSLAKAGAARVETAQQTRIYDLDWLMPGLHQSNNKSAEVSNGRGSEAIPQAPQQDAVNQPPET